jgi:hypothetical protein
MRVAAILVARVIAFVEVAELNPRGKALYPDAIRALVQRYGFQKFPSKLEEFDETKGVEFLMGKEGDYAIDKFVVYNTGLMIETRSSTDVSREILERLLLWAKKEFGLVYESKMITRWAYVSSVIFHTDFPILDALSNPLRKLARRITNSLAETSGEDVPYEPVVVTIGHDALNRKYPFAGFSLQRRAESPFSENKYFSEAPLRTDKHIALLEELENDVVASLPTAGAKH